MLDLNKLTKKEIIEKIEKKRKSMLKLKTLLCIVFFVGLILVEFEMIIIFVKNLSSVLALSAEKWNLKILFVALILFYLWFKMIALIPQYIQNLYYKIEDNLEKLRNGKKESSIEQLIGVKR